jgi:hypothetical protein
MAQLRRLANRSPSSSILRLESITVNSLFGLQWGASYVFFPPTFHRAVPQFAELTIQEMVASEKGYYRRTALLHMALGARQSLIFTEQFQSRIERIQRFHASSCAGMHIC